MKGFNGPFYGYRRIKDFVSFLLIQTAESFAISSIELSRFIDFKQAFDHIGVIKVGKRQNILINHFKHL